MPAYHGHDVRVIHEARTTPHPEVVQERNPFSGSWSSTLALLRREAGNLGALEAVLVVDTKPGNIGRRDGGIRHDAKVESDYVEVFLPVSDRGPIRFECGRFESNYYRCPGWQANVRAIALGMEALRKVRRYGIADDDQQYRGWQALPPGGPISLGPAKMTPETAARVLADGAAGIYGAEDLLAETTDTDRPWIIDAYRMAVKVHHPDAGGDPELFRLLTEARDLLLSL